jgi:hypothetical protein
MLKFFALYKRKRTDISNMAFYNQIGIILTFCKAIHRYPVSTLIGFRFVHVRSSFKLDKLSSIFRHPTSNFLYICVLNQF